jgi:hypothetical protein
MTRTGSVPRGEALPGEAAAGGGIRRTIHQGALVVIGLSLLLQTVHLALTMALGRLPRPGWWLTGLGLLTFVAAAAAFAMLLLCLARGVRRPRALAGALGYALALVWPVLLGAVSSHVNDLAVQGAQQRRDDTRKHMQQAQDAGKQFSEGWAWARQAEASAASDCQGAEDFVRGCREYVDMMNRARH